MRELPKKALIERGVLQQVGDMRLAEAESLRDAGFYGGAVYLAGYAVECWLKAAICATLCWDGLRGTFKTHDLEGLMLYSGFDQRLRAEPRVVENFAHVVEMWVVEGDRSVRYRGSSEFDELTARLFLKCVNDPETGVVPWLRKTIS